VILKFCASSADNHVMLWRRTRKREDVVSEHHVSDTDSEYELNTRSRLRGLSGYDFDESEAQEVEARIRRLNYGAKVEDYGDW
jgi:hypothetical protein